MDILILTTQVFLMCFLRRSYVLPKLIVENMLLAELCLNRPFFQWQIGGPIDTSIAWISLDFWKAVKLKGEYIKPKASGNGYFDLNIDSEESNFDVFVAWGIGPEMIVENTMLLTEWSSNRPFLI